MRPSSDQQDQTEFPKLARPARRALAAEGYTHLEQLAALSEADLLKLHGIGPGAIEQLRNALDEIGLRFAEGQG